MDSEQQPNRWQAWAKAIAITAAIAAGASYFAHVPFVVTLITVSGLPLIGFLVTIDDDLPGGFANPDGTEPFPWRELVLSAAIPAGLIVLAVLCPWVRHAGGA